MQRKFFYGLIMTGATLAGTITSVRAEPLNIKTGLWETTMRSEAHGQLPIPQEQLQKMSPQMRAAMEKMMARLSQPRTMAYKYCVTQQELNKEKNDFMSGEPGMKCDSKLYRHTRTSIAGARHCAKGSKQQTVSFDYEVHDREHVTGKFSMTMSNGANTMTSQGTMSSRWLSASCGKTR